MFWRSAGFTQPSPIEGILERDNFTLEDILDEDDVIQECKSLNSRLIVFLRDRGVIEKLIRYLVEPPPEDADVKRRYKYPYVACEIFTCEVDALFSAIFEGTELLDLLFSLLDRPAPLPSVLAGYFAKVMNSMLSRRTSDSMLYLQGRQHLLGNLVKHLGTTSIAEVVMQLVGADEQILMFHAESLQWLADTSLLELILDSLAPENSPTTHANAAEVLTSIARTLPSALANQLGSPMYLQRLFQHAQAPGSACQQSLVLDVCMALLDPKRATLFSRCSHGFVDSNDQGAQTGPPANLIACCLSQLESLVPQLNANEEKKVQYTTYGQLSPPLGTLRLKIVEFLSVLVRAVVYHSPALKDELQAELLRLDAVHKCLELFLQYPFHSLLHNHVDGLLMAILESGQDELLLHLLVRCELLDALSTAPEKVKPKGGKMEMRAGNMGHVTRLSNKIQDLAAQGCVVLAEATKGSEQWREWVEGGLRARNAVENLTSWQCGRPSQLDDSTNESDNDEDMHNDIGLNSMANNMQDTYHRYSTEGGNDKDDDDDDDEEEDEAEDGAMFINSTDVLASLDFQSAHSGFVSLKIDDQGGNNSDSSEDSDVEEGSMVRAEFNLKLHEEDEVLLDDDDEGVPLNLPPLLPRPDTPAVTAPVSRGRSTGPPPPPPMGVEEKSEDATFNTFNFWKVSYNEDLVPDDA